MLGQQLTLWTIRCSLALYAAVILHLLRRPQTSEPQWPRYCWFGSCCLFLVHVGLAFHFYHDWSHAKAFAHTENETHRLMGLRFGYGIYFNHLFAAIWLTDAVAWLAFPAGYARRPPWLHKAVHLYMFFIAFNGAVVFEDGPVRWVGVLATLVVGVLAGRRWLGSLPAASKPEARVL